MTTRVGALTERIAFGFLVLLTAALPLLGGGFSPTALLVLRLLALGTVGAWLASVALSGRAALPPRRLLLTLVAYLGAVGVSVALSAYRYGSVQAAFTTTLFGAVFVAAAALTGDRARRRLWLVALAAAAALSGGYALVQAMGWGGAYRVNPDRVSSFFTNSNHFSGLLTLVVPLFVSLALAGRRGRGVGARAGFAALALLLVVAQALTFSWGFAVTVVVVLFLLGHRARFAPGVVGLAMVTAAAGGLLLLSSPALTGATPAARLGDLYHRYAKTSVEIRLLIARGSLAIVREHPLVGVGPGNYPFALTRYRSPAPESQAEVLTHGSIGYAHNDALQVAGETGLLGLVTFVAFWGLVLTTPSRLPPAERYGLVAGLSALLLYGVADGNLTFVPANALLAYLMAGVLHAGRTGQLSSRLRQPLPSAPSGSSSKASNALAGAGRERSGNASTAWPSSTGREPVGPVSRP